MFYLNICRFYTFKKVNVFVHLITVMQEKILFYLNICKFYKFKKVWLKYLYISLL